MSQRNTVVRALHDAGAAAWFGGSLMGAIGVNGAATAVHDPRDRARVAAVGWAKWAPVNAVAIGAHLVGGAGILWANRDRAKHQQGVTANTTIKIVVTGAALAATAYSGLLGAKTTEATGRPVDSATEPSTGTPPEAAAAQKKLQYLQYVIPVLTGTIVVLGAQQGEQQRPAQILAGVANKIVARSS
ncbi:MAG: hypothetical protein WBQ44_13785 [Rhodococcus sp. (in: high G+C Gram-positive bacteria)]